MDSTYKLLRAYLSSTPEERKAFWKLLEQIANDNDLATGFYHPYIPLQEVKKDKKDNG